jgi:hypothetical protein
LTKKLRFYILLFSKTLEEVNEMAGFCPRCGRVYCDHSAEGRGETKEEFEKDMNREPTPKETAAFESKNPLQKIIVARETFKEIHGREWKRPDFLTAKEELFELLSELPTEEIEKLIAKLLSENA